MKDNDLEWNIQPHIYIYINVQVLFTPFPIFIIKKEVF